LSKEEEEEEEEERVSGLGPRKDKKERKKS